MNNTESGRASAEARKDLSAKPSRTAAREDHLLRYLGALCYEAQHGRANPDEVQRVIAQVDDHVRTHGPISMPGQPS
ncbi:MAG: hypothetical protein ACRDTH_13260 [Pseudonocardiaceae bacterium]